MGREVINHGHDLLHFGEIVTKEIGDKSLGPLLLARTDRYELTRPGKSLLKVLLKLIEHFRIGQQTRLALQTDKVAHEDKKRLERVEHQDLQAGLISSTFEIQRSQA